MGMMLGVLLLAGQAATAPPAGRPTPAAVALGERLAQSGTLATLLPLMVAKDTDELVRAHPQLSAAERTALIARAKAVAVPLVGRMLRVEGEHYAEVLSEAELGQLVAAAETPAARHLRASLPYVIAGTMAAMGEVDFKREVTAAFCRETGKLCAP